MAGERLRIIVLEGGPGVGKTTLARILADMLSRRGYRACIVDDAMRGIAPLLDRLFGRWYQAPREVVEYMFLGYQLRRMHECLAEGSDVLIFDYSIESPLAYMSADGVPYPSQLEKLAEAAIPGDAEVYVFILEQPVAYSPDSVRWEDIAAARKYARHLVARAVTLASRLGARVYVVPERETPEERSRMIISLLNL